MPYAKKTHIQIERTFCYERKNANDHNSRLLQTKEGRKETSESHERKQVRKQQNLTSKLQVCVLMRKQVEKCMRLRTSMRIQANCQNLSTKEETKQASKQIADMLANIKGGK